MVVCVLYVAVKGYVFVSLTWNALVVLVFAVNERVFVLAETVWVVWGDVGYPEVYWGLRPTRWASLELCLLCVFCH